MKAVPRLLAASGWPARIAFALSGLAALAAPLLPVDVGPVPERRPAPAAAAPEGSAVRRPLFDRERRAWTAQGTRDLVLRPDPVAPVLVLRGIRLDGGEARAFIDDGSGNPAWLAQGEGRGDWRIAAITLDRVTVSQRDRPFEAEFLGRSAILRPAPFADAPPALRR